MVGVVDAATNPAPMVAWNLLLNVGKNTLSAYTNK
jgi:hypothetical protein